MALMGGGANFNYFKLCDRQYCCVYPKIIHLSKKKVSLYQSKLEGNAYILGHSEDVIQPFA